MLLPPATGIAHLNAGVRSLALAEGLRGEERDRELQRAAAALERARRWLPGEVSVYRELGRAYLLRGQADLGVPALEEAVRLQPQSLLARYELADAYARSGRAELSVALWHELGVSPPMMIAAGDTLLGERRYGDARLWYERALPLFPEGNRPLLFRSAIAATLNGDGDARHLLETYREGDASFEIYPLRDTAMIPGGALRWMLAVPNWDVDYGSPLAPDGRAEGTLWWSGEALAVISVEQAGTYLLSTRLLEGLPAPVEMAVGVDGVPLQRVSLSRGDQSWAPLALPVELSQGLHTINVWFLNNEMVDGKDRDGRVGPITLERSAPL